MAQRSLVDVPISEYTDQELSSKYHLILDERRELKNQLKELEDIAEQIYLEQRRRSEKNAI